MITHLNTASLPDWLDPQLCPFESHYLDENR